MKLFEISKLSFIDNVKGAGATPQNQDVDYFGLRVKMKPSAFLHLALPISDADATSADGLKHYIKSGGKIGSPFFTIIIPNEWHDGDFEKPAKIRDHEGRNRMKAVHALYGDVDVEVHFFFTNGIRAKNITDEWVSEMKKGIISEYGTYVSGQHFETF